MKTRDDYMNEAAQEAIHELWEIKKQAGDIESDHLKADYVLTSFLEKIGFQNIVEAFDDIKKWYA